MFTTALEYLSNTFVVAAISLVVGVVFSQKVKDYLMGIPADVRTALNGVEAKVKQDLAAVRSDVLQKLPVVLTPKTALAPAPAAAPIAAAPAAPAPAAPAA